MWYYTDNDRQRLGPISTDQLRSQYRDESIGPDTLVWRDGMLVWRPLGELAEQLRLVEPKLELEPVAATFGDDGKPVPANMPALPSLPEPEPEPPPLTGRAVFNLGTDPVPAPVTPVRDTGLHEANPYAPPGTPLQGRLQRNAATQVVYAGFRQRLAAVIVDGVLLGIAGGLAGEMLGTILGDIAGGGELAEVLWPAIVTNLLYLLYYAWFHSGFACATPGKMLIGIKVVRSDGEPISFLRAVGRYFAELLSTLPLFGGYFMAIFTARKQTLHDMICDTVVVDRWAFSTHPERQRRSGELGTPTLVVLFIWGFMIAALLCLVLFLGVGIGLLSNR